MCLTGKLKKNKISSPSCSQNLHNKTGVFDGEFILLFLSLRILTQNEGMIVDIYRHVYLTRDLSKHNCTFCY